MSKKSSPKITKAAKSDFTKITFKPDLEKFGMTHIDDDLEAVLKKRVYDIAGCLPQPMKVFLNEERIKIKGFKDYVQLYLQPEREDMPKPTIVHQKVNDRWEVAFAPSDGQFQQVKENHKKGSE